MACSDNLVAMTEEVPRKERRVEGKEFAREIDATREALVVVAEALGAKNNGCGACGSSVETDKAKMQQTETETGEEAVATEQRSLLDRFFDEYEVADIFEETYGEVDEEVVKEVAELQHYCQQMWIDCVDRATKAGLTFGDPSNPHCIVARNNP